MGKRHHISAKMKVDVAFEQAGGWVYCPICEGPLRPEEARILEHMVPHELGGETDTENLRWVHKDCASTKTNGSRATSAGGDLHKIAKAKRLSKAREAHEAVLSGNVQREKSKLRSRGFDKSLTKKFNGKVVPRG